LTVLKIFIFFIAYFLLVKNTRKLYALKTLIAGKLLTKLLEIESDFWIDCISVFGFGDSGITIVGGRALLLTPVTNGLQL
jgi:hypothetical protein